MAVLVGLIVTDDEIPRGISSFSLDMKSLQLGVKAKNLSVAICDVYVKAGAGFGCHGRGGQWDGRDLGKEQNYCNRCVIAH